MCIPEQPLSIKAAPINPLDECKKHEELNPLDRNSPQRKLQKPLPFLKSNIPSSKLRMADNVNPLLGRIYIPYIHV